METELRTSPEPRLQLAALRCPGRSAATARRVLRVGAGYQGDDRVKF